MAYQRQGHPDDALRWLDRIRTLGKLSVDQEASPLCSEAEAVVLYDPVFAADPFALREPGPFGRWHGGDRPHPDGQSPEVVTGGILTIGWKSRHAAVPRGRPRLGPEADVNVAAR